MDNGSIQRPTELRFENIKHSPQCHEAYQFIREASAVWNPSSSLHDLFYQLHLKPNNGQINDMIRNAKLFSSNALKFVEFVVLAAEFRKYSPKTDPFQITSFSPLRVKKQNNIEQSEQHLSSSKADGSKVEAPEVFLGGSCNPTTWRADVAMPELKKLGISFFNPQVSQWTPDLMHLEHRAKQKARVLFFVIDSETRASAGTIEVAHLSGQNQKPLILVLHKYKRNQKIFNESISEEEYLDLSRNQRLLRQLVTQRGIQVHDNILQGLKVIREISAENYTFQKPLGSVLCSVRKHYDRVVYNGSGLTIEQCRQQLISLSYRKDLVTIENLKHILSLVRDVLNSRNELTSLNSIESSTSSCSLSTTGSMETNWEMSYITFQEFCLIVSYLSVLQQEIIENTCVSPIKGINLPPPPIYLTNTPEVLNHYSKQCSQNDDHNSYVGMCSQNQQQPSHSQQTRPNYSSDIETSSQKSESVLTTMSNGSRSDSSRDSGTSSPQPNETNRLLNNSGSSLNSKMPSNYRRANSSRNNMNDDFNEFDSDSSDSVFSTSSSQNDDDLLHETRDIKDIYLGGSCMLRTKWRNEIAIPYLESKNISYYLPTIHDNLMLKESKRQQKGKVNNHHTSGGYHLEEVGAGNESLNYNPKYLDSSRVLLFVITNETRSLAPMTLAAHYIGLGYNVVLSIQMLPENCTIGNDKLTSQAIKDYNRGRAYLRDLAERQNIPVFSEIKQALDCAIEKVKLSKPRCSV